MTSRLGNLHRAAGRVRTEVFSVLVVGEFNRGKSTLLNALLGRKVLPAFATETTATVCEVHFGETPRAGGMFLAGPAGAFVGARLGPTQMLKSAIPQIALGAGILMFTPLGWVAAGAAMAMLAVVQVVKGVSVLETKLRAMLGTKFAEQLNAGAADQAEKVAEEIASELDKFRHAVDEGLAVRIEEVQNQFDALLDERRRSRDEVSSRRTDLETTERKLDAIGDDIAEIIAALVS